MPEITPGDGDGGRSKSGGLCQLYLHRGIRRELEEPYRAALSRKESEGAQEAEKPASETSGDVFSCEIRVYR